MPNAEVASVDIKDESPLTLRGTSHGLELLVSRAVEADELAEHLERQLSQSPEFFSGGDAVVRFATAPASGTISKIERVASAYQVRIVGVYTDKIANGEEESGGEAPAPRLSKRKPRSAASSAYPLPATRFAPEHLQPEIHGEVPLMIPGPVRSGCTFEAPGHLVIVGDVNPGAEIRAVGNIVVLGSLRGIAHAGCQGDNAFILALKLQPQQLRIGNLIARAADADGPASGTEIAYASENMILVDEYQGRLPANIAASI